MRILLTIFAAFIMSPAIAQGDCPEEALYNGVQASDTYRTVELPEFGLEVDIPSNYRTMKLQDGGVEIVHPQDYALLQCVAQGRGYGRGYYSEEIHWLNETTAQLNQVVRSYQSDKFVEEVVPYTQGNLTGYLVKRNIPLSRTSFIGTLPETDKLLVITPSCDCDVEPEATINLLSRVRAIQ